MISYQNILPRYSYIKKWPGSFNAGISISNDIEFTSLDVLDLQMKFLNTNEQTSLGAGVDLEMSNSIFFYSDKSTLSYFDGQSLSARPSTYHRRLAEYMKEGIIDTNHGYGDFAFDNPCTRNHILRVYEELEKINVKLDIYTNHGGEQNVQTIGEYSFRQGDDPSSTTYHVDVMMKHGVKWIWTEAAMLENENKKKIMMRRFFSPYLKLKNPKRRFFSPKYIIAKHPFDKIYKPYIFWRYRNTGYNAPNASSFMQQLKSVQWDDMVKNEGGLVIYQHLGVEKRVNKLCTSLTVEKMISDRHLFTNPILFLKEKSEALGIWVAALSRYLNYIHMIQNITICIENSDDKTLYIVKDDGADGYPIHNIEGLTMFVPLNKKVEIFFRGQNILYKELKYFFDKKLIMVPLNKFVNIW